MSKDLSIVIPLYKSAHIVKTSIQSLIAVLDHLNIDYEILLRDDASGDSVRDQLNELLKQYPRVKVFYNSQNQGLGFTLRRLFQDAKGEKIIYLDCDLPFGAQGIPILVENLKHYDIAVASRYLGTKNHVSLKRKLVSQAYYVFCKLLFGIAVRDIGSGSVGFRKKVLDQFDLKADGFDIHIEWFVAAKKKGAIVKEIPLETQGRGINTFSIVKHGPKIVLDTLQLQKNR